MVGSFGVTAGWPSAVSAPLASVMMISSATGGDFLHVGRDDDDRDVSSMSAIGRA
jgi:hypothetical protein